MILFGVFYTPAAAQEELAALLEVQSPGVEVQRAGTASWIPVSTESIVGIGDAIRTDASGQARITFFETGADVEIAPDSEFRIQDYSGNSQEGFTTTIEVLAGITRQQVTRFTTPESSFDVVLPGMALTVRGTDFDVRVEDGGRSSLVTLDGEVSATAGADTSMVEGGFGVRSNVDETLSPVVPATNFEELDAGLDGFDASFQTPGDVQLNVRLGPGRDFQRVGIIAPQAITTVFGTDESGEWYRIAFREGFGWVSGVTLDVQLTGVASDDFVLPVYREDRTEDIDRFTFVGEAGEAVVVGQVQNLREGPGLEFEIIQRMFDGDVLSVLGRSADDDWLRVSLPDGTVGWANASLLQINVALFNVPIVDLDGSRLETPEPPSATSDAPTDDNNDDSDDVGDADDTPPEDESPPADEEDSAGRS